MLLCSRTIACGESVLSITPSVLLPPIRGEVGWGALEPRLRVLRGQPARSLSVYADRQDLQLAAAAAVRAGSHLRGYTFRMRWGFAIGAALLGCAPMDRSPSREPAPAAVVPRSAAAPPPPPSDSVAASGGASSSAVVPDSEAAMTSTTSLSVPPESPVAGDAPPLGVRVRRTNAGDSFHDRTGIVDPHLGDHGLDTPNSAGAMPMPTAAFDRAAAAYALGSIMLSECKRSDGPTGQGHIRVTFGPGGGVQSAVIDEPPFAGSPVGGCIAGKFRSAHIPAFAGAAVSVGKSFVVK